MKETTDEKLIRICDEYTANEDKTIGSGIKDTVKSQIQMASKANKGTLNQLRISRFIILLYRTYTNVIGDITLNINLKDNSEVLDNLNRELLKMIDSLKKDKNYIKELRRFYSLLIKGDPENILGITPILSTIIEKENNVLDRANYLSDTAIFSLDGVNCILPNYTEDKSKSYDAEIDKQIELIKK